MSASLSTRKATTTQRRRVYDGVVASHGDKALSREELTKGIRLLEERILEEANKIRNPEDRPEISDARLKELLQALMDYVKELKKKKEADERMARVFESLEPIFEYLKKMGIAGEKLGNSTTSM